MADFPGAAVVASTMLSTFETVHSHVWPYNAPTGGGTWPAINRALYVAVVVEVPVTVYQMAVWPTVQSGNLDVGIYSEDRTRVVSKGSTPVGTANALQAIDIADTQLDAGVYFLAMCVDNTTAAFQSGSAGNSGYLQICGVQQQAVGAVTLPATATFANPSSAYVPLLQALVMSAVI